MPVIDVQVHPFDRNHPGRPWASPSHGLQSATGEEMVAAMNSVGVDGAIMVSSFSAYEYDPSYALEVYNTYPDKFRVVTPVDATDPAIDDVVAKWAATPGARGIRIRMRDGLPMEADHPGLNRAFAAAGKHGLPVNLLCWGILDKGLPHIRRHPDTVIVIDHLGLLQPARPPVPADVWADLPKLLALAQYDNVRVKISGACTMSHQPFPYDDIWDPVLRVIDAFGLDRCMWGTDWTRTIGMLTYEQGVAPFRDTKRLSENDKASTDGRNAAESLQVVARQYPFRLVTAPRGRPNRVSGQGRPRRDAFCAREGAIAEGAVPYWARWRTPMLAGPAFARPGCRTSDKSSPPDPAFRLAPGIIVNYREWAVPCDLRLLSEPLCIVAPLPAGCGLLGRAPRPCLVAVLPFDAALTPCLAPLHPVTHSPAGVPASKPARRRHHAASTR